MRIGSRTSSAITAAVLLSISCPAIAEGETIASAVDASDSIAATPRITVGFDTVAGERRYADRTAGDGITVVHFSSVMPRTGDSIGDLPNAFPVSAARISSGFGSRIHPVSGRWSNHAGIDLAVATGTAVAATASGVVSFSGWSGAYGYLVVVNHGDGLQTYYGHLSRLAVSRGDSLGAGDLVGLSGSTGRSTGPHLHYEVRRNGVPIDPMAS